MSAARRRSIVATVWAPVALAGAVVALAAPTRVSASGPESAALGLSEKVAPAVVSVRVVVGLKISMQGRSMEMPEQNQDMQGTIVDPSGLVMAGSEEPLLKALEATATGMSISVSLRGFHVQVPGEAEEREAVLVAKDGTLGLGFLQIVGADGAPPASLPSIDLSAGGDARTAAGEALPIGTDLFGVSRMGKAFDYAPEIHRAFVCGRYQQPRVLSVLSGDFTEHGMPVYDADGRPVGVFVAQSGAEEGASLQSLLSGLSGGVLPLDVVRASVARVKKLVPAALEKAKAGAKSGEKPDAAKPDAAQPGGETKPPEPAPVPTPKDAKPPR